MTPINQETGAASAVKADIPVSPLDKSIERETEDGAARESRVNDDEDAEGEEVPDDVLANSEGCTERTEQ